MSKVVFITGAAGGLGLGIAQYLANRGYTVYGTSRRSQAVIDGMKMLVADVTDGPSIEACISQIVNEQGRLDVVINNAGLGIASPLETVSIADVQQVLDTNITGVIRVVQAALPQMRLQRSGLIINISSIGSEIGLPYRGVYSATKAAVDRLSEAMRMELTGFGIQVCIIQPGGVKTDINKNRIHTELITGNAYKNNFDIAYEMINKSVDQGLDVKVFGELVFHILQQRRVKAVYRIGTRAEKMSVLLKSILPSSYFEKMVRKHYGLK